MPVKRLIKNQAGFTLTEVMVGIMILTIAVVSATNLLVGLIQSNQNNMKTVQAYYLAQEGIEAVRNVRDSNWLHNNDWLGDESGNPWGANFKEGGVYALQLKDIAWKTAVESGSLDNLGQLGQYAPWQIGSNGEIYDNGDYMASGLNAGADDTGFKREISIKKYDCTDSDVCPEDAVLVESKVTWTEGVKERAVSLNEVMTNWKGGVL